MSGLTPSDGWTALLPGFIVAGIGVGLLNPVIADVAVSVVAKERSGMAAGINDTFRQVGDRGRRRRLGSDLPRPGRGQDRGVDRGHVREPAAATPAS